MGSFIDEKAIDRDFDEFEREQTEAQKRLGPARNYGRITPKCCATCKYHRNVCGFGLCLRKNGFTGDEGDLEAFFHLCDGYVREG